MSADFGDLVRWRHAHSVGSAISDPDIMTDQICSLMSIPSPDEWEWFLNTDHRCHFECEDPQPSLLEEEEEIRLSALYIAETPAAETDQSLPAPVAPVLSRLQLLPGEIRRKIFDYVLDGYRVLIYKRSFPTIYYPPGVRYPPEVRSNRRLSYRHLAPREMKTQELVDSDDYGRSAMFPLPLGLMLSCKSIYEDTLCYFYANTQFVFASVKGIREFLDKISPQAREVIRFVEIDYTEYKMPRHPKHLIWKSKSDEAWLGALTRISDELPSLKVLHLQVTMFSDPLGEAWGIVNSGFFPYLDAMNNLERLHWMKVAINISDAGSLVSIDKKKFLKIWRPQFLAVCKKIGQLSKRQSERLQVHGANETQPRWMPSPKYEASMSYWS